jgi:RHS repeat-associated protein
MVTDQVGSVRLVVNTSNGLVAQRIDYDEFGNVLSDSAPAFQPFGFAGGLRDRETGLTRLGARDYDPVIGRWTSKDRIRFVGGVNFYEYVGSDPVNYTDPTGLDRLINPQPGGPCGPTITFSPGANNEVDDALADMVEKAATDSRLGFNISATTNGKHGANSRHYGGKAVDINVIHPPVPGRDQHVGDNPLSLQL